MTLNEGPDSTFGATTHERRKDDSRTLKTVIPEMEALIGNITERLLGDKGCRGHNAPPGYKFRVFISGQKRRVTPKIKRELRRRSAIEPVIGHLKSEHSMGRNYLWHRQADAANAVLAAAGYNFRLLIRWLELCCASSSPSSRADLDSSQVEICVLHGRLFSNGTF